jgi:hypothetical protein
VCAYAAQLYSTIKTKGQHYIPYNQKVASTQNSLNFTSSASSDDCSLNNTPAVRGSAAASPNDNSQDIKINKNTKLVEQLIKNIETVTVSAKGQASKNKIPINFHIQTAINILNDMIDSLDLNDPVLLFLKKKINISFELQAIFKENQIAPNIVHN